MNAIVYGYEDLEELKFYLGDQIWLEIKLKHKKTMPANIMAEQVMYLKFTQNLFAEKFKAFTDYFEKNELDIKVSKVYERCSVVEDS